MISITPLFTDGVKPMIEITKEVFGYPITVTATPAGSDWNVVILGGCTPHVGSVSLAEYQNGTIKLRNLLRDEHKDQIVGDRFAHELAKHCHCAVCVSCGIHFDKPSADDLTKIVFNTDELLNKLCSII